AGERLLEIVERVIEDVLTAGEPTCKQRFHQGEIEGWGSPGNLGQNEQLVQGFNRLNGPRLRFLITRHRNRSRRLERGGNDTHAKHESGIGGDSLRDDVVRWHAESERIDRHNRPQNWRVQADLEELLDVVDEGRDARGVGSRKSERREYVIR